jgi:WD40 repeat protein
MRRITVIRVLMATALVVILALFPQTEGRGRRFTMVECVSFSSDGSRIVVSKLNAHDAQTPMKLYKADVSRTLSLIAASTGTTDAIVHQDLKPGNCGAAFGVWWEGRTSAVINPNNDRVVTHDFGGGNLRQYGRDGQAEPIGGEFDHPAFNIAMSKSGQLIAASGRYGLTIFDAKANKNVMRAKISDLPFLKASLLAFSSDETRIAVASGDGLHLWDIATGTRSSTIVEELRVWIKAMAMAPDDTLLVCSDEGVRRYDVSGRVVSTLTDSKNVYICCVSNDGRQAALIEDGNVLIFDLPTAKSTNALLMGSATALAFSPDAQSLAVGDYEGMVSLIDLSTAKRRWMTSPPGRYLWPWTFPASLLGVWGFIAWRLSKNSTTNAIQSAPQECESRTDSPT